MGPGQIGGTPEEIIAAIAATWTSQEEAGLRSVTKSGQRYRTLCESPISCNNIVSDVVCSTSNPSQKKWARYLVCAVCLLVFLLALNAKVSKYESESLHRLPMNPASASKLWLDGEKNSLQMPSGFVPLFWLAAFLFAAYAIRIDSREPIDDTAIPRCLPFFELHRFLRPPPARALIPASL